MSMINKQSPWGKIDGEEKLAGDDIIFVNTPGHGGLKLSRAYNQQIPALFRIKGGWYEEDCAWAIVPIIFPQHFTAEQVEEAHRSLKSWNPYKYMEHFKVTVTIEESYILKKDHFLKSNIGNWVGISASQRTPDSLVEVTTALITKNGIDRSNTRLHLVPKEEYEKRDSQGFIVDECKHTMVIGG